MLRRKGRLNLRRKRAGTFELPLTSLMDAMVIILVFLLKSSATSSVSVEFLPGMELPLSSHSEAPHDATQLLLTSDTLQFQSQRYQWAHQNAQNYADFERALKVEDTGGAHPLAVIADKRLPYQLLAKALKSAAKGGFTEFRFFAIKPDS